VIPLCLLALGLAQDVEAATAFQAFEQTLARAKTVSIRFTGRQEVALGGAPPATFPFSGELLLKGPTLARYRFNNGKADLVIASDGATLQAGLPAAPRTREAPADLRARFFEPSVARAGLMAILALPTGYTGKDVEDRRSAFTASAFMPLEPEAGLRRLRYSLTATPSGRRYEITLALDAATGLPRRRTLVGQDAGSTSQVEETYEPWVLDGELADDAFTLPMPR
jgi:outer membrane lipoprotein-sorting protein